MPGMKKKESVSFGGSQVISGAVKPLHSTKVRLHLPAIVTPTPNRHQSIAISNTAQQEFIAQLNAHNVLPARQKLNPIKVLTPYRKKLTTLEAQRIIGVLDELKLKCEVILALPNVLKDLHKYETIVDEDLIAILEEHSSLLKNYSETEKLYFEMNRDTTEPGTSDTLIHTDLLEPEKKKIDHADISSSTINSRTAALNYLTTNLPATTTNKQRIKRESVATTSRSRSRSASDSYNAYLNTLSAYTLGEKNGVIQRLNMIKLQVEFSIKNILRALRNDEEQMTRLLVETGGKRYKEGTYFLQCLAELRDMLFERLLVAPHEQNEKMQYLAQIAAQERNNQLIIKKLEADLAVANEDRDKEVMKKNDKIRELQANLEMLEKATEDDIRRTKSESEKQCHTDNRLSQLRKEKLDLDMAHQSSQLATDIEDHRDAEMLLRKKRYKLESEVENWIQKYDEEMTQKQEEYEKIEAKYNEEKKQLAELESRFKVIEEEYKEIMRVKREEKENKEDRMRMMQRQVRAVVAIQALYRSFRVRRMLKNKSNKKGKGKKKKKKKAKK